MKGFACFSSICGTRLRGIFGAAAVALLLTSCTGDTGPQGEQGQAGPPAGIDIGNAEQIDATITGVTITSPPVVVFTLTERNGNPVKNLPAGAIGFTIAKLVPGTDGNASAWQSYVNQIEDPSTGPGPGTEPEPQAITENGSLGTLVESPDGTYTYTFATDVANVTDPFPVAYDPNLTHRVSFEIRGFAPVDNPTFDFRPSDNATTGLFSRTIVKTKTCNVCHERLSLHGGARFEEDNCQTCHNPGSIDANSGNTVDYKVMVHKIHRGEDLPSVIGGTDYCIYGFNNFIHCYGDVAYPQDIRNCENCHNENDPDTPDAANWYQVPTAEACGSCHDDVNFETGTNHATGPSGNDRCTSCHVPDKTGELGAWQTHRILTDEEAAKYELNIETIDFLGPGNAPRVTFSVTDPTNSDMPYDLENDPDLTNALSSLTFYTAWETTDYENAGNANSTANSTQVYSGGMLQAMPAGMFTYWIDLGTIPMEAEGSGTVVFAGKVEKSIGRVRPDNTHTFFAITDDPMDPTPRRTKVDLQRCDDCHGRLAFHSDGTENIDMCATCHNPGAVKGAGGPMDMKVFIHRIHAVDGIRYPQRTSNCVACHTEEGFYPVALDSGVLAASFDKGADMPTPTPVDNVRITPNAASCSLCHTHSDADATLHMEQNGAWFDACQDADGTTRQRVNFCGPGGDMSGAIVQESCTVCHAPGRTSDVAVMHKLNLD